MCFQAVKDVTAALEEADREVADLKRQKARHAALAAVAVAKVAQKDADIKLAEEELGLLEEKAEEHEKQLLELQRKVGLHRAAAQQAVYLGCDG